MSAAMYSKDKSNLKGWLRNDFRFIGGLIGTAWLLISVLTEAKRTLELCFNLRACREVMADTQFTTPSLSPISLADDAQEYEKQTTHIHIQAHSQNFTHTTHHTHTHRQQTTHIHTSHTCKYTTHTHTTPHTILQIFPENFLGTKCGPCMFNTGLCHLKHFKDQIPP